MTNLIQERATAALLAANGDRVEADRIFTQWLDEDESLFRQLMQPLVKDAVWKAIKEAACRIRRETWEGRSVTVKPLPSETTQAQSVTGLEAMAETQAHSLLDNFPLPHGGWLGDATHDEVAEAIVFYHKQAHGNKVKAVFLEMVLKAMGKAQRVRDGIDEQRARTLRDRAQASVPPVKEKAQTGAAA